MGEAPEVWRSVPGYEGLYSISANGKVRSEAKHGRPARILQPSRSHNGYLRLYLCRNGRRHNFSVHQLVASAFMGPVPIGHEVNHRDGDKSNNRVSNLAYVTHSENLRHAHRTGLLHAPSGVYNTQSKLNDDKVRQIRALHGVLTTRQLAARFGVSQAAVSYVISGRTWRSVS